MQTRNYFLKKYVDIHIELSSSFDAITYINTNFPIFAKTHFDSKKNELDKFWKELRESDFETWKIVNDLYKELSTGKQPNVENLPKRAVEAWLHLLDDGANYQHSILFIHEMNLISLVTKFNEFLKDMLKIAFSLDPQTKESWNKMSNDERETMVYHLVEDDIKKAAITIRKTFGLDLKKESDWRDFAEYTYRRHVFIHNRGFPSEKYRKRTGYRGSNEKLTVDKDYIIKGISIFKKYSEIIEEFFIEKHLDMVNITKKSNVVKIDLTKNGGKIIPASDN